MVVNLTVHRNTLDKRKRLRAYKILQNIVRERRGTVSGFALVTWDEKNRTYADWVLGGLSSSVIPEFTKVALMRRLNDFDTHDIIDRRFNFDPEDG